MQETKFEQIDALRFFAVFPVLVSHWGLSSLTKDTQFILASNGVNLFFAISGFLITLGLIKSREKEQAIKTSLWKFYVRRFLRIFPIYYLMLLLLWFFNHPKVADGIWWYLSYSTNFYCIKIQDWGGLPHLWSLSIEEQFYFVWPFIILLVSIRHMPIIILLAIFLSLIFKIYCLHIGASFFSIYMNPINVLDILGLGALLAYYYHFKKGPLRKLLYSKLLTTIIVLQVTLILYLRFSEQYSGVYQVTNRFSFGLFSTWLIGRSAFGFKGLAGYLLNLSPLKYIGKISYGVYLLHILIPGMLMGLKYPIDPTLRFCMYFIVTVFICSLSWTYFESKILKFKDKFE